MRERRRIFVEGIVQGVGFRPFVYGLATQYGLPGFVLNHSAGVKIIEVEGEPTALETFLQALRGQADQRSRSGRRPECVSGDASAPLWSTSRNHRGSKGRPEGTRAHAHRLRRHAHRGYAER